MFRFVDLFATWDHNGDGFISKSEVEKKGKQWSDIKDYDLNSMYLSSIVIHQMFSLQRSAHTRGLPCDWSLVVCTRRK